MMPEMCPGGFEDRQMPSPNIYLSDGTPVGTVVGSFDFMPGVKAKLDELTSDDSSPWRQEAATWSCKFKMSKSIKRLGVCKSRKRFIKLMMSHGTPRNMAHELAKVPGYMGGLWSFQFWYVSVCRIEGKLRGAYKP